MNEILTCILSAIILSAVFSTAGGTITVPGGNITPLDYSNPDNWMIQTENPVHEVDLFYIYPSTVSEATESNGISDISDEMMLIANRWYSVQGTAFADYCNVYAPYYRQLSMDKGLELREHDAYTDYLRKTEPKADIYAAIDYYFKNINNGRPYILAGHSQGSALIQIVLEEYMKDHPEYYKNMVAAYSIGWGVNQEWLDANPHLKFAEGETDTGVIISWNTEYPKSSGDNIVVGEHALVINPLNWKTDETYADKSLNKGSLTDFEGHVTVLPAAFIDVPEYEPERCIIAGLYDAQIDNERGVLTCRDILAVIPDIGPGKVFGDGSMHTVDYDLYYINIKENGKKRIDAFLAKNNSDE
ncbi:MAG TPA: DUF3089 domain-containing protein [Methanocorpusculum sp.]|nr:DUF3089 domain-containing protein [Methanocorpusculum sp.]